MTTEPPVTPQELREIAAITESLCGANLHDLRPAKSPCKDCIARANRLHSQADWLELHMPLYREAVGLLPLLRPVATDDKDVYADIYERKRALLTKVKGTGNPCICGGTGMASRQAEGFRREVQRLEQENESLRKQVTEQHKLLRGARSYLPQHLPAAAHPIDERRFQDLCKAIDRAMEKSE